MTDQLLSETECKIMKAQSERRLKYRMEFLRMRTDPFKHSQEPGYIFDPALQRYMSLKACQFENFQPNTKNIRFAILSMIPMFVYGYFVHTQRCEFERGCRCGKIRPRNRLFKLQ